MPIIKSAIKKLRQDRRREAHRRAIKKKLKEAILAFKKKPTSENLSLASSQLDKAAKRHVIHRNKASRLKSNLSSLIKPNKKSSSRAASL
ncbi:30S ribosomal protein S20 [Candidatus Daviesbacteria bacterium]|nr:30S ribosomal protein S20 [Candidatus Daviesbacteria bacterium]